MTTMKILFEVAIDGAGVDAGTIDKIVSAHNSGLSFELFGEKFRPHAISYSGPVQQHYTVEVIHVPGTLNREDRAKHVNSLLARAFQMMEGCEGGAIDALMGDIATHLEGERGRMARALDGPINEVTPGKRIPVAFSDPEMQRAYDAGEPFKTNGEKRIEHLENLLASASLYVEAASEKSSIARRLYKKVVDAFEGGLPEVGNYDERIASLEEFGAEQSYTEEENFTEDYMLQKDWAILNDDATVYGCTLRHVRTLLEDYTPYILQKNMRGLVAMPPRMIQALEADKLTGRFGYYGRVPDGAATEFYNAALADVEAINDSMGKGHESYTLPQIVALLRGGK